VYGDVEKVGAENVYAPEPIVYAYGDVSDPDAV
jgi:hypothetical protein